MLLKRLGSCTGRPAAVQHSRLGDGVVPTAVQRQAERRGGGASTSGYPGPLLISRRLFGGAMLGLGALGLSTPRMVSAAAGTEVERVRGSAGGALMRMRMRGFPCVCACTHLCTQTQCMG